MTKKVRVAPTVLIMIVTGAVLFGGWALYQKNFVKQPVEQIVQQHAEITRYHVDWQTGAMKVQIQTKPGVDVRQLVQQLTGDLEKQAKGNKVVIEYMNEHSTPEIDKWWSQALFDVAEAMVHQNYSHIPSRLQELQQKQPGIEVQTEMDNQYVYITLKDGQGSKTMLLPLEGTRMGVWPNEKSAIIDAMA